MKAKKFIILLLLFYFVIAGISNLLQAQDISKYQALFMSKFIDYVQWPDGKENLVVGIVGNSRVLIELQKTVGQKNKATVKKISSAADAATCDMIFLPTDQNKLFSTILSGTEGKSVLIITEGEELAKNLDTYLIIIKNAGHINLEFGYDSFEFLLDLIKKNET